MTDPLVAADVCVPVHEPADVVMARKQVRQLALQLALTRAATEELATAVSELAWNIIIHGGGGQIGMAAVQEESRRGLLVIAHDQGPGIPDPEKALEDGYSTKGTLGLGLSGARRMVDQFELVSAPGKGTTIVMKKWAR